MFYTSHVNTLMDKKNSNSWKVFLMTMGFLMIMMGPTNGYMPLMVTTGVCMVIISLYLLKKK